MRCALAGLLILLLGAVAWAEVLPHGDRPVASAGTLEQTLALLDRVDPQTLPVEQRRSLYLALADALLANDQQERALDFLVKVAQETAPEADEAILARLQKIASPMLAAALQAGTPLAPLARAELTRRGEPLPPAAAERIIGVLLPLSGRHAPFGQEVQQALELARTTQAPHRPVRFSYRDTAAENTDIARLVEELAGQSGLLAIIGPLISSDAAPAAARAEQEKLPLLLLAPREGTTGGYVFRNALTVAAQMQALADYARDERLQRIAIIYPDTRYGELTAELFKTAVESLGGQVVARQNYPSGTVDLRQQLQALAADARRNGGNPPDALFIPDGASQVAQIIPQLGFSRLDLVQLLGTNAWNDPELVRLAGPQVEGAVFVDGFFAGSPRPEVLDFVTRFRKAYGAEPSLLAAQGYDAARMLLTLLDRPEIGDRATLCRELATLRDFPGVTGMARFSPQGEAVKSLFLLQVQDGAVVQIN